MTDNDAPEWGPRMAVLNDRQKSFVLDLFMAPKKRGRLIWAAKAAGYGTATSSNKSLGVIASRLMADERIQAAIAEESQKRLRGLSPDVVSAIEALVNDPKHRDHGRALAMVLDRSDPVTTTHNVTVTNTRETSTAALKDVVAKIDELARRFAAPLPAPKIIDGECREVA